MKPSNKTSGFTLVELAIVLVIIGLIVGGVLAGQDLIKAAEIRASISQMEKYDTATNTFRGKYNGLPGDMLNPANFGFADDVTAANTAGDGDGLLEPLIAIGASATADDGTEVGGESSAFFAHLSAAGLISEGTTLTDFFTVAGLATETTYLTPARLGRGALIVARAANSQNFFYIGVPDVANTGLNTYGAGSQVPVIDAFQFDTKLDDSVPDTGKVVAVNTFTNVLGGGVAGGIVTGFSATAAADDLCMVDPGTGASSYNTSTPARAAATRCVVRVRASF